MWRVEIAALGLRPRNLPLCHQRGASVVSERREVVLDELIDNDQCWVTRSMNRYYDVCNYSSVRLSIVLEVYLSSRTFVRGRERKLGFLFSINSCRRGAPRQVTPLQRCSEAAWQRVIYRDAAPLLFRAQYLVAIR